jgi:hypothetical protein
MNQAIGDVKNAKGDIIGKAYVGTILWRFFQILAGPPMQESAVILGNSPTAFVAPTDSQILIVGGTGVSLTITRKGTYNLPSTIGYFPVSDGDILTITYTTAPTVTYFPC